MHVICEKNAVLFKLSKYLPHRYPVTKLLIPAQNKAGASAIFRSRANATVSGINVPKSPNDPEISGRCAFHNLWPDAKESGLQLLLVYEVV